jgi:hypothetical protein
MAWLRKIPMYAVVLLIVAVLIGGAGLGYFTVATFGATVVTGQQNSNGSGEPYEWNGQRLYLKSADSRQDSTCVITGRDGAQRSLRVPRNTTRGMFSTPDFAEVAPQPGSTATILCSRTVSVFAGDTAAARARTVNSRLFRLGVPALIAIPVLAAIGIPLLRRTRNTT